MPIAKRTPTADVAVKPAAPQVEPSTVRDIVVDHASTPVESLNAYLDGMPWTVDYFGQLLGEHSDLRELDPGANAAWQQYQRTNELELRVATALSSGYEAENSITIVSGSAIIVHVVPNVNDYFIAEAGSREMGLFRVTGVERRTFNRDSVYQIDYTMVGFARDTDDVVQDLLSKVVREYHFSKDRLAEGLSPVLREDDYVASFNLAKSYQELITRYFRSFFNNANKMILVPVKDKVTYDVCLVNFLTAIMDSREAEEIRHIHYVSTDGDRYFDQGLFWTTLLDRNYDDLKRIHQKAIVVPRSYFNASSWLRSTVFWAIDQYVYPKVLADETAVDRLNPEPWRLTDGFIEGTPAMEIDQPANLYTVGGESIPLIKSVLVDDFYVLSGAFYEGGTTLSVLEILVRDYLKSQTIDLKQLAAMVKAYPDWPALERFYYGPLIILLLKDAIKGFYI